MTIRIGVAGWDYPDWNGIVYPARPGRRLDRLAYVSRFVDVVEINSTFYRPASPKVAASWVRRTGDGFRFTAKAHRSWTHETDPDLDETVRATLSGLAPLRESGKLGALLIQFPQSFHRTDRSLKRVDRLAEHLDGWPAVVEVRHVSWENEGVEAWLRERRLGWCAVDQPRVGDSTAGLVSRVTGDRGYLRLHGRNATHWFRPDAGRDARYDYLYSESELRRLAEPVRAMAESAPEMFVVQNNHFRGQALVNALQLKSLLQDGKPAAPEELVAAYPELAPAVRFRRQRLF